MALLNLEQQVLLPVKINQISLLTIRYIKALEGYFDTLAAAAVNEKSMLQQMVLNNNTLTTSNEILVDLVKNINQQH